MVPIPDNMPMPVLDEFGEFVNLDYLPLGQMQSEQE
jgi:hypothetical protein